MDLKKQLRRLKETGKFDPKLTAGQIGQVLDFYNQSVDKKSEREYSNEITARNEYFLPMIKHAITHGPSAAYKSNSTYFNIPEVILPK